MGKRRAAASRATEVQVSFERSLVGIIGDEHYPDAEYLFTELAANAYDADATEVRFTYRGGAESAGEIGGYKLIVEDNGNGMKLDELQAYFTFGSQRKVEAKLSPRFRRPLIGRFGLGKVSALKAAQRWFLETEHEGRRLFVDVDFERWMRDDDMRGFEVSVRPALGKNGTRIELVQVRVRGFRHDRIVRAVRKLPLGAKFRVYLNGTMVPPRELDGIDSHEIDEEVHIPWPDGPRTERVRGVIWVNDEALPLEEGKTQEKQTPGSVGEVLEEDLDALAGVEVKVHGATVYREFFGRQYHGHGVNYLWGYVHADWLPVVANRTDFVRDSEEGDAFYRAMEARFTEIWKAWRANEKQRKDLRRARSEKAGKSGAKAKRGKKVAESKGEYEERDYAKVEKAIDEVAARIRERLEREPESAPYMGNAPKTRSGRPSTSRLNPLFTFRAVPRKPGSEPDDEERVYPEFSVSEREVEATVKEVKVARERTRPLARAGTTLAGDGTPREVTQPIGNLQLALQASSDLPKDAAYRWDRDHKGEPVLRINVRHPLHRAAAVKIGSEGHRLYLAMVAALALAEHRWSVVGRQGIADYVIEVAEDVLSEG